jgi:hypothetical protein
MIIYVSLNIYKHYCTGHVYGVVHFCDNLFVVFSWTESVLLLYHLFLYVLLLELQLSGEGWDPINMFNTTTF